MFFSSSFVTSGIPHCVSSAHDGRQVGSDFEQALRVFHFSRSLISVENFMQKSAVFNNFSTILSTSDPE